MKPNYTFNNDDRDVLFEALESMKHNPYREFSKFQENIERIIANGTVPESFIDYVVKNKASDPIHFITNCPVDKNLPTLSNDAPVDEKHNKKKTFVGEGFLTIVNMLFDLKIVGHKSVNNGDFFHDIFPVKSMYGSQSQKTLETLRFHKDFTNHFVIPDHVAVVCLRDAGENEVVSTFARNSETLDELDEATRQTLRSKNFFTPFDDISAKTIKDLTVNQATAHAVIYDGIKIKYFEGRTEGMGEEAQQALLKLQQALHRVKIGHVARAGDLVVFNNDHILHGKEVRKIVDEESLKSRWLMKTHHLADLKPYEQYFCEGSYGVVQG